MNQLGFLHLILLYVWLTSIFLKNVSLYIRAKFFRSEMPQNIYLRNWLIPSHLSVPSQHKGCDGKEESEGELCEDAQMTGDDWLSLRNTVKQDRLNKCMLVHCHKTLADATDPIAITRRSQEQKTKVCLKHETKYIAGWIGTFRFFIGTHSPHPCVEDYPM